jgi:hypothetical protein
MLEIYDYPVGSTEVLLQFIVNSADCVTQNIKQHKCLGGGGGGFENLNLN